MSSCPAIAFPSSNGPMPEDADHALLAGILQRVLSQADSRVAVVDLLARFQSLAGVAAADKAALHRAGLDAACIDELSRVRAMALEMARVQAAARPVLSSWSALTAYLRAALAHAPREQFRTLYLDRRNILMREEWRADGTVDHAPVYNAGPARVAALGRIPRIKETQEYVETVVECYLALTSGRRLTSSRQCKSREAE